MTHQTVAIPMTLSDFQGHSPTAFCIPFRMCFNTAVQQSTRFQQTHCVPCGPSAKLSFSSKSFHCQEFQRKCLHIDYRYFHSPQLHCYITSQNYKKNWLQIYLLPPLVKQQLANIKILSAIQYEDSSCQSRACHKCKS